MIDKKKKIISIGYKNRFNLSYFPDITKLKNLTELTLYLKEKIKIPKYVCSESLKYLNISGPFPEISGFSFKKKLNNLKKQFPNLIYLSHIQDTKKIKNLLNYYVLDTKRRIHSRKERNFYINEKNLEKHYKATYPDQFENIKDIKIDFENNNTCSSILHSFQYFKYF